MEIRNKESLWHRMFSRGSKMTDREKQTQIEIGIRALKASTVLGELWCEDKATAEGLVADELKLTMRLAANEMAGKCTEDDCVNVCLAARSGKYKIAESSEGGFTIRFFGIPSHGKHEDEILTEIELQISLCQASQALGRVASGQGKPKTKEEFVGENLELVARRVMPKYSLSEEQFADLYLKAVKQWCKKNRT